MNRVNEALERVFGPDEVPETLSHAEFAALAGVTASTVRELIHVGRINAGDGSDRIPTHEFLKYAFEENLRELGEERDRIQHVLRSVRKR